MSLAFPTLALRMSAPLSSALARIASASQAATLRLLDLR